MPWQAFLAFERDANVQSFPSFSHSSSDLLGLSFASFAHRGEVFLKMLNLGGRASGGVE